jgi:hypothetical protein
MNQQLSADDDETLWFRYRRSRRLAERLQGFRHFPQYL